jgi:PAS domain S-box-containing protein
VRRRREAEDQLRELNETLEARVEERTRERDRASETATAIFNSTNDGILTLNARGGIETINLAAQRMFGYSAAEVVGRDAAVLLGLSTERPSKGLIDRLGKSWGELEKGVIVELEARRQDGSGFAADLALSAMELGHETHVVAVVRDISDRKRVERLKDEFVATVSHELRTPLTSIAGSLGLLNGGAFGALPEGASKLVRIAHSNCGRLVRLINDILDIEKIGSGKLKLERTEVDVSALVARSVDEVRPCAREAAVDLQLRADEPLTVQGDADRLNQVVTNLLANAIKFSPASGVVEVSVTRTDDTVRVAVRDYGPGIPEDFRSRIFSKFAQADSSDTRGQGGSGLGLSIAKEIVEHHEGRLWFESTPGEGAVFYVDLPHQPAPAAAAVA